MLKYHDEVWGTPKYDDTDIFEALILDTFQAGLSWAIILNKRDNFARAFHNFDPKKVAQLSRSDLDNLMQDKGIVRNRLKIEAAASNAKNFLKVAKEFGSFSKYIWGFVNDKPIQNNFKDMHAIPAKTELAETISKDLKKRGFKFVGPTVVYAFMQGIGLVNDHTTDCFRYKELQKMK